MLYEGMPLLSILLRHRDDHYCTCMLFLSFHRYLNDLYVIDTRSSNNLQWEMPTTVGMTPSPRESHTCVATSDSDNKRSRLIVYGGMSGCRLGDLHQLDIGK